MARSFVLVLSFLLPQSHVFSWSFEEINSWIGSYSARNINLTESERESLPYILKKLPALQTKIPYISLSNAPTPVKKLSRLGENIGVGALYFKDDGLNAQPFGGNKIRKLEFLFADAIYSGAKSVITIGDAGSNCVLATLAQAKRVGFEDVYCLLGPQLNTSYVRRNLLLDLSYGGIIKYYESEATQSKAIVKLSETLREKKQFPYIVSWGATCPIGFLGYMNAAIELKEQIARGELPEPDYIYVPLGSAGTAGGLILGAQLAGLKCKVIPVAISGLGGSAYYRTERLAERINEAIDFFVKLDPTFPIKNVLPSELEHRENFANYVYAEVIEDVSKELRKLFDFEGIKLEGTYTGKALAVMLSDIAGDESLRNKNILFWNTFCYGTFEDVTKKISYKDLPKGLHKYFEEDVQKYDGGL
ncbi:pyridoxal-phosphate dependent enzyme [Candidatus Dependentiae bacterium]|nr:pyridoxal-phosphate dependent enzyme [Candidatus Dependentiae bacterium]